MSYDLNLEDRIDQAVETWDLQLGKKKMFGGLGYFIDGKMCFAIRGDGLLLRVGLQQADGMLIIPGVQIAQMGKRIMKNWLQADGEALQEPTFLKLLTIGRDYALAVDK